MRDFFWRFGSFFSRAQKKPLLPLRGFLVGLVGIVGVGVVLFVLRPVPFHTLHLLFGVRILLLGSCLVQAPIDYEALSTA